MIILYNLRFESLVNSSSGKTAVYVLNYFSAFESLVNSSSGKTTIADHPQSDRFESLVNSSSGKTVYLIMLWIARLRALLIQVVVKRLIMGAY